MALRPYITNLQHGFAGYLLLDIQVVVLHVRSFDVAIKREGIALVITSGGGGKQRSAVSNRASHHTSGKYGIGTDIVVRRAGIEIWRIRQVAESHVLREGVKEQSEAGADYGRSLSRSVPCDAHARSKILLVGIVKATQSRMANLGQRERIIHRIQVGDIAKQVVLFLDHAEVIPAQAVVNRHPRGCPETILYIETEVVLVGVPGRIPKILEPAVHLSRKKILKCISSRGSIEGELPTEVLIEILLDRGTVIIRSKLDVVLIELPGKAIEDLIVAIDAMPRQAAGRGQLRRR